LPAKRYDHPVVGHTEPEILKVKNDTQSINAKSAMDKNAQTFALLKKDKGKRADAYRSNVSISMLSNKDKTLVEFPIDTQPPQKPKHDGKKELPKVSVGNQVIVHQEYED
jgi:hypothetical protein